jgi:CRISPR system Cascade subunit CasD
MANTLFLRLEAPLQAWGERARWTIRDTTLEPTKSGVVGLLGCALGLSVDEDLRALSRQIKVGIRCDKPGEKLDDYHTVFGGVLSAEGKVKETASTHEPETVVSWRSYLSDASFLVTIQAEPEIIGNLAEAVQNPCWPIFLGRKSCPPSRPVFDGMGDYASLKEALESKPIRTSSEADAVSVRIVMECSPQEGVRRRDEMDSRIRRTFLPRYVKEESIKVTVTREVE